MIELDEKSLLTLGQITREVAKTDKGDNDLLLGKFIQNIYVRLQTETMRNMREEKNKEQQHAV